MQSQKTPVQTIALLVAIAAGVWLVWPQLATLVFTALMAFVFYPVYVKLRRGSGKVAAVITLLLSFLVVIIPLAIVMVATIGQLASFAENVSRQGGAWQQLPQATSAVIASVNDIMEPLTGQRPSLTEQSVLEFLRTHLPGLATAFVDVLLGMLASLPGLGIALLLYTFFFLEFLRRGPQLVQVLGRLSPFSPRVTEQYFERLGLMSTAMVSGQLMIAMIIAVISAALLIPLGYGHLFFVFFILFTILNFIPLGSGIVVIPLSLYAMVTGQFWLGLLVVVLFNAAGWLDPLLRPRFIPKKIQLSSALMLLSVICGVAYFGILGVVYGPIMLMLVLTTIDMYVQTKRAARQ